MSTPPAYAAHLPRFVLSLLCDQAPSRLSGRPTQRRAAVMFCDISGFTPLSETLGRHGKHGTEELTVQLNGYFETLLGVIEAWGGDTVKFGGDAVTVVFEAADGEEMVGPLRRATACAREIFEVLGVVRTAQTPWGDFPLSLKVGLSSGPILTGLVGDGVERMETVVAGDALDRMAEAEHHAKAGDIVLDLAAEGVRELGAVTTGVGDGFGKVTGLAGAVEHPAVPCIPSPPPERVRPFLLPAVWGQITAGSEAMLGEHRQVATAFVAFPGLDYGALDSLPRLEEYFRRVHGLLTGFGGSFNRMDMGDKGSKFLCFFGAPESYEDNAERAVAFALSLRGIEKELPWTSGQRTGLSLGTNFCGLMGSPSRREYTVMGDAVNTAARLMGASKPGEILAVQELRKETQGRFKWGPYRSLALKGKSTLLPVSSPLHALRRQRGQGGKSAGLLVGRSEELELLRRARKRAGRGPTPYYVLVGEAGIGKTAVLERFLKECREEGCRTALGRAHSVGAAPLQSWSDVYRTLLGGERGDREAIESRWRQLLPEESDFLGLGLRFLGFAAALGPAAENLDPRERQEKTTALLAQTLRALANEATVVVGLDGLNHADAGTKDLITALLPRLRGAHILFVGASRPGEPVPGAPHKVPLRGLGREDIRALAGNYLDADRIGDALVGFAEERTGGNPLFLLELLQNLKDRGALGKDREGRVLFHPGQAGEIPGNIEGLLLARVDRLPLVTRNVLKVAACLGLSFDLNLLQTVFLPRMERELLQEHLLGLTELGLVPHPGPQPDTYLFSHATLRETAYGAVLLANRRSIHRSAAESLVQRLDAAQHPWIIAYHYGAAEEWGLAAQYGLAASVAHMDCFDFKSALVQYDQVEAWAARAGISLQASDLLRLGSCALQAGQHDRALRALCALEEMPSTSPGTLLEAKGLKLQLLDARGDYASSVEVAEALAADARRAGNENLGLDCMRLWISGLFRMGRLEEAALLLEGVLNSPLGDATDLQRASLAVLQGAIAFQRGQFESCRKAYEEAKAAAGRSGHYPTLVRALIGLANMLRETGQIRESLGEAQEAYRIARLVGSRENVVGAATTIASAFIWLKEYGNSLAILDEVALDLDAERLPNSACAYFNQLGVTHYFLCDYKKAVRSYRKCRQLARRVGIQNWVAFSSYNIADTLKTTGEKQRSISEFRDALSSFVATDNLPYFVQALQEMLVVVKTLPEAERAGHFNWVRKRLRAWPRSKELPAELLSDF